MRAKALVDALRFLSSGKVADDIASAVVPRRVAGPDVPKKVRVEPMNTRPASITSMAGTMQTEPNPSLVQYYTFPKNPQDIRQMNLDMMDDELTNIASGKTQPYVRKVRNVGLGTGVAAGALPPSLYALWLMSQDDED
jgi:hypothetical protein